MAKQKGWTNSIPVQERTFLTMRELGRYTGISYDLVKKYVKGGEFEDYITVGKQNKVMVDRIAFEKSLFCMFFYFSSFGIKTGIKTFYTVNLLPSNGFIVFGDIRYKN